MSEQLQIISVCENEVKEIRCTSGEKMRVMFANFGRLNNHTCPHDMYDYQSKTDCRAQTSLERVQDKCQDTTHCKLKSTTTFFNVDPCFGIFKYLLVKYKCD